jgi:hypothetical protein
MKIEKFIEKVRSCKRLTVHKYPKLKATVNPERTVWKFSKKPEQKICRTCGTDLTKSSQPVEVEFNNPQKELSIFQANLLFLVFKLNQSPYDYANYHKCIAGQRFIKNIKEIK